MDETSLYRFQRLIAAHTGLQLRPRERDVLRDTLVERMAALHLQLADEYLQRLQAGTPDARSEWGRIITRLTNKESYFFRDRGQMALLRERILPELIARNQARRILRLWSAGCSTGEEAYSLAMLADELLPQHGVSTGAKWEIVVLGTDIDEQALQQARRGIFGPWSFRSVDPALQRRYFHRHEGDWQIEEASRSRVTFRQCNLVGDAFPDVAMGLYDMDLILCRNVFIYFEREAVTSVLLKFAQTLRTGGYLMTGHVETYGRLTASLQMQSYPESVIYQRMNTASAAVGTATNLRSTPKDIVIRHPSTVVNPDTLESRITNHEPRSTIHAAVGVENDSATLQTSRALSKPIEVSEILALARTYANLGRYEAAIDNCERLIKLSPAMSEPYELLASIAQEQGRVEEAGLLLKKALYLAPANPSAYLELGALYRAQGDMARANKMHGTALELLQQMLPEDAVGPPGGPNVKDWILHLTQSSAEST